MAKLVLKQSVKGHGPLVIFSLCPHVTFYKTLTSLSTVSIKAHVGLVQQSGHLTLRFFNHLEPFSWCQNKDNTVKKGIFEGKYMYRGGTRRTYYYMHAIASVS